MTLLTETDPLVNISSPSTTSNRIELIEVTVQDVLDKAKFSLIDVMFLVALGLIAMADSMQACYLAIVLPVLK